MAELTGHPVGYPSTAIWSLSVADPTETLLLEIARAAADGLHSVLDLAGHLAEAGWTVEDCGPGSQFLCQMVSADARALIRSRGAGDVPGGWAIDGDGVRADATDNVPAAVLAALATAPRGESAEASDSGVVLEAERPEPPEPDTA